jgi:hypothetical protein
MTITDYDNMSVSEKKKEDWMNSKWRPAMGWMYMVVCFFDFVGAPILWSLLQAVFHGGVNIQWQPLTLQGAGLFHVAMGAVLGLAAWGRTQEKLNGAHNGGIPLPASMPAAPGTPSAGFVSAPSTSFTPAPSWGTTTTTAPSPAFGTKPTGPAAAAQPEL